jgi:hypothetical protein
VVVVVAVAGVCFLGGGAVAAGPSTSDAGLFGRESAVLVLPGLLLLALSVLCGVAAGAGEMLILGRGSAGAGFSASDFTVLSSAGFEGLGPAAGGVDVPEDAAAGDPERGGPPSLASLRRRICSMVSWSGASGVDDGGGCSLGSIVSVVDGDGPGNRGVAEDVR